MSWERAGRLAWIAPPLTAAFVLAFTSIADYADKGSEGVEVFFFLTFLTYAGVGALVASRRPRNPVGWLFCVVGVYFAGSEALYAYARDPSQPPGVEAAAWIHSWTGEPAAVAVVLLVLLFPTGHFLSRRWRVAGIGAVAASGRFYRRRYDAAKDAGGVRRAAARRARPRDVRGGHARRRGRDGPARARVAVAAGASE